MHVNHALHGENLFLIYYSLLKVKLNFLVSSVITAYNVGREAMSLPEYRKCSETGSKGNFSDKDKRNYR